MLSSQPPLLCLLPIKRKLFFCSLGYATGTSHGYDTMLSVLADSFLAWERIPPCAHVVNTWKNTQSKQMSLRKIMCRKNVTRVAAASIARWSLSHLLFCKQKVTRNIGVRFGKLTLMKKKHAYAFRFSPKLKWVIIRRYYWPNVTWTQC